MNAVTQSFQAVFTVAIKITVAFFVPKTSQLTAITRDSTDNRLRGDYKR